VPILITADIPATKEPRNHRVSTQTTEIDPVV